MATYNLTAADRRVLERMQAKRAGSLTEAPKSQTLAEKEEEKEKENNGGILGGIGYLGEKLAVGFMQTVEGIWDYSAAGIAKLFGNDEFAEEQMENDWFGDWYSHPDEWYNPSEAMQIAGDVAGGIGTSLPSIALSFVPGVGPALSIGSAALGAAGNATKEAYRESGELGGAEFGYGALSGATEGLIEFATMGIGKGTGRIIKSISKRVAGEGAEAVAKTGVKTGGKLVRSLAEDFATEAFEEGFSEWVSPYYKRMTYDESAENASAQDILYSALVGGLSGMAMSGGEHIVSRGYALGSGSKIVNDGKTAGVMELGRILTKFETQNKTGDEIFTGLSEIYTELKSSLAETGGEVTTARQRMLLYDLRTASTAAIISPAIQMNAKSIALNAEAFAERINTYYKSADGSPMNVTAEQLRAGFVFDKNGRVNKKSFSKALKENELLRSVAASLTAGQMMMDADRYTAAVLSGKQYTTDSDLARFVETASDAQYNAVSQAVGISDLSHTDAETFNAALSEKFGSGELADAEAGYKALKKAQELSKDGAKKKIPLAVPSLKDGEAIRYYDGNSDIAIVREGFGYRICDYATENVTKSMTKDEVGRLLRQYRAETVKAKTKGKEYISDVLPDMREKIIEKNIVKVAKMDSVTSISGEEFQKGEIDLITQVSEYFDSNNNKAENEDLGTVTFDRRGVKDDIAHGIGRKKAASFAAVPEVIKQGIVVDYQENWKNRGYDTAVIAAPIEIGGAKHYMGIVVISENNGSRFYVHEVVSIKEGAKPFKTGTEKNGVPGGNAPSVISILQKILDVNTSAPKTSENKSSFEYRSREAKEIDALLREKVKDYAGLSDANKGAIRKLVRDARKHGISEADILTYARVSAHSGIKIKFNKERCVIGRNKKTKELLYSDGFYDISKSETVINPEGQRTTGKLLVHELTHAIYRDKEGRLILEKGVKNMSAEQKRGIIKKYSKIGADSIELIDEINAHYVEGVLGNKSTLEALVSDEPTLIGKILNFFKGAISGYSGDEKLSADAKRLYKTYKKLFEQFSEQNRDNAVTETVTSINSENMHVREENKRWAYIGDTKDDRRCYVSDFDSSVSMDERVKLFKERIATIFNLGAVELKTDVKKIKIKGDKFTAQKNIYGDLINHDSEQETKVNSLYDLADILSTAKYDSTATNTEDSYINPNNKPKNAAHKGVKYWYKFKNEIVFDGVPFTVTFNIRDKGKEQFEYLIEFKENKTPGLSNTAVKNLLRTDQASYNNSIHKNEPIVNNFDEKNKGNFKQRLSEHNSYNASSKNVQVTGGEKRYALIDNLIDVNGVEYGKAVLLDTHEFDGISLRNWGKMLEKHLSDRTNKSTIIMPVVDENGNVQNLEFANKNERVSKNGGAEHSVLGKLYRTSDNISKLATIQIDEVVSVSSPDNPYHTSSDGHGWLDVGGWLHRTAYVVNVKNNAIYKIVMDIAKARDGRVILYALDGKTKRIGNAQVNSIANVKGSRQNTYSGNSIHENKSIVNTSDKKTISKRSNIRRAMAGESSATAEKSLLTQAKLLEDKGVSSEEIRKETGWFKGYDGEWRYEIDDSQMEILISDRKKDQYMLGEMIKHDKLFAAYPQLKTMTIDVYPGMENGGSCSLDGRSIEVGWGDFNNASRLKRILLHEIQHAIQIMEGFALGADASYWQWYESMQNKGALKKNRDEIDKAREKFEKEHTEAENKLVDEYISMRVNRIMIIPRIQHENRLTELGNELKELGCFEDCQEWLAAELKYKNFPRDDISVSFDKYKKTAGEIEARDVAARAEFTPDERKKIRPDIDQKDVLFSDYSEFMAEYTDNNTGNNTGHELPIAFDSKGFPVSDAQFEFFKDTKITDERGHLLRVQVTKKNGAYWLTERKFSNSKLYYADAKNLVEVGNLDNKVITEKDGQKKTNDNVRKMAKSIGCKTSEVARIIIDHKCTTVQDVVAQTDFIELCKKCGEDGIVAQIGRNTHFDFVTTIYAVFDKRQLRHINIKNPRKHQDSPSNTQNNLTQAVHKRYNKNGSLQRGEFRYAIPDGVDFYTEEQYNNNRGWASELLSSEDKALFNTEISRKNSSNSKPNFSDKKYLYEVNNKLIISDGNFESPTIEAIIDINVDNATNMQSVLEVINEYGNISKRPSSVEFYKDIKTLYRASILTLYQRQDFSSFNAITGQGYPTRSNGYKDFGYSGEQRYGGKGKPKLRGVNTKSGLATVVYRDGIVEQMPYDEYVKIAKKQRHALPEDVDLSSFEPPFTGTISSVTTEKKDVYQTNRVDLYTEEQYNRFGWAREADALTFNELDDLYSVIKDKRSLSDYPRSSNGEYIIEVNNKPRSTLDVNNVFVFIRGSKNNPEITRIIRAEIYNNTEMEEYRNVVYERENGVASAVSVFKVFEAIGIFKEFRRENLSGYSGYLQSAKQGARQQSLSKSSGANGSRSNGSGSNQSNAGDINPYIKVVHTFTDISGGRRNVVKFQNQYNIEGNPHTKYLPTIEAVVEAENSRVIRRYAESLDLTVGMIKDRLKNDPDYLKKIRKKFAKEARAFDNKRKRHALPEGVDARTFSYDELVSKGDLTGTIIDDSMQVKIKTDTNGYVKIDSADVFNTIKAQCKQLKTKAPSPTYYVNVPDIGRNIEITKDGVQHGYAKGLRSDKKSIPPADMLNARVSLKLPEILSNSIEVNISNRSDNLDTPYSHVMIGTAATKNPDGTIEYYAVRSVIEERINQNPILAEAKILGKLHAVNTKKVGISNARGAKTGVALTDDVTYTYSISQFLEDVKGEFDDTFSSDVYDRLSVKRKATPFSSHLRHALTEGVDLDNIEPIQKSESSGKSPVEITKWLNDKKISVTEKKKRAVAIQRKIEDRLRNIEKLKAKMKDIEDTESKSYKKLEDQIKDVEKELDPLRKEYKAIYISLAGSTLSSVTTEKRDTYAGGIKEKISDLNVASQVAIVNEYAGLEHYLRTTGMAAREAEKIAEQSRKAANMGAFAAGVVQFDPADFDRGIYTKKEWVENTDSKGRKHKVYEDVPYFKDTNERVLPKGDGVLQIFDDTVSVLNKKYGLGKVVAKEYFSNYLLNLHNISRMSLEEKSLQARGEIEKKLEKAKIVQRSIKKELKPIEKALGLAEAYRTVLLDTLSKAKKTEGEFSGITERIKRIEQEIKELNVKAGPIKAKLKSASKAVSEVQSELDNFVEEKNKPVFGENKDREREIAVTADESRQIVEYYEREYPEFIELGKKVHEFFRNLLKLNVYSGIMTESQYHFFIKKYPHYIPTDRLVKRPSIAAVKGKNNVEVKSTIRRAQGGGGDIAPLLETATERAIQAYRTAFANRMANAVYEGYLRTGDTKEVQVLERERVKSINPDETPDKPKQNQVTFYRNGEKITMQVTTNIYSAFKSLNETTVYDNVVSIGLQKLMNLFKALVTDYNPLFLITNIIKDRFDAVFNSRHLRKWFKNAITFRGARNILGNSTLWQLNLATGGMASSVYSSEKGYTAHLSKRGLKKIYLNPNDSKLHNLAKRSVGRLLNGISNINAMVEQSTRMLEFQAGLESGGTINDAMLDAAEVTTNFGRKGAVAKHFNALLSPFLNAQIQGASRIYRNLKASWKEGIKGMARLLFMAAFFGIAPQILNQLMMGDDDEYKELRDSDKQNYFIFKLGDGEFIKIPKGRVMSAFAGAVVQATNAAQGQSADFKEYGKSLFSSLTPADSISRTILAPIMHDLPTNTSWNGSAIEGQQFDNTRPGERYDENTSGIAIAIGKAINYSPKKIHYLIDQYTGVIGDVILPLTTLGAEKGIVKNRFTVDSITSNKLSTEFYKLYDEAQYSRTDYANGRITDDSAVYQVMYLNRVKSEISALYDQKKKIQASTELNDYDKIQHTRAVQLLINEVYRNALNDYELMNTAIKSTEALGYATSDDSDKRMRYTEAVRIVYGAEKALSEYNEAVYSKMQMLNKSGVNYDTLYAYYFASKGLESDVDKNGAVINGSKRKKMLSLINSLNVSTEQKLMLLCAQGYSIQDGDVRGMTKADAEKRLLKYILSRKLSKAEKASLAEACGFTVKNGKIIAKKQ